MLPRTIIFVIIALLVAVTGFLSARTDIQIIIGLLGLFTAGIFYELAVQERDGAATLRIVRKLEERLAQDLRGGQKVKAVDDFKDAVQIYQSENGNGEAGSAIRELATYALRQKGYLK